MRALGWRWMGWLMALCGTVAVGGTVRFDFETGKLQGWAVAEGKFDRVVADWAFFHNRPKLKYNKQGRYYLNTLELRNKGRTDAMTGVLESPVFLLQGTEVTFLVGGGSHRDTYVALCDERGKELMTARGKNTEMMQRVTWNVSRFVRSRVFVRIVDKHTTGWGHVTFDDFEATGAIDPKATAARVDARSEAGRAKVAREARELVEHQFKALRLAIADLADTLGPRYPRHKHYLSRLDKLAAALAGASPDKLGRLRTQFESLQREALVANPLVGGRPLVFVVRQQYRRDHHNTATMFQTGEINTRSFQGGGALKLIDLAKGGKVTTLVNLPHGVARDPEVSFDGRRILFSMRRDIKDDYHLYEIRADGTGLKQLTFGAGVSDIDPLYLPDGRIAFTSTREPKYCMCNRHIMGNLFRMDADGANIHQIGRSTLFEGHGSVMPDGRILYDRWEYVDRNFGDAQGVWTCNPDGTNHVLYWGNNTRSPGAVLDNRIIPGTERFIATLSSCHDRPWGAIGILDRRRGTDGKSPILRTWPGSAMKLVQVGNYDTFKRVRPKYEDPYPLSPKHFLCVRQVRGDQMGIVLLDVFGNEVVLHTEAPGCYDPMPVAPRRRPVTVPDRTHLARSEGTFYVHDVYIGTGMERVKRGTAKWLRVVESPEKRFWARSLWNGSGTQAPGMNWDDFNNKRILGTVPVEPDGSAYFAVPADRFVYFQLLDANGMMIQSMRSGTITRPGERTGCIGCHEDRLTAMPNGHKMAYSRPPSKLVPWHGAPRRFNYTTEVQPVFDKHCVRCHDFGKPGAKKLVLAGDHTLAFNVSYMELRRKRLVRVVGAGPAEVQPPYSWGSHASKLVAVLRKGHNDVKLDPESLDRIITWIDINAPYYPSYASAYPGNLYGRSPLDGRQLGALSRLTGLPLTRQSPIPQISFTRPELSPCLGRFKNPTDPKRAKALAIIQAGTRMLATRPRMDMPGAKLLGVEATRQRKYERLARVESEMRKAILDGAKRYHKQKSTAKKP